MSTCQGVPLLQRSISCIGKGFALVVAGSELHNTGDAMCSHNCRVLTGDVPPKTASDDPQGACCRTDGMHNSMPILARTYAVLQFCRVPAHRA